MNRRVFIGLLIGSIAVGLLAGCNGEPPPPEVPAKKFPGQAAPTAERGGPAVPPKPTG